MLKEILLTGVKKGCLSAQKTHLGWILSGKLNGQIAEELQSFSSVEEGTEPIVFWSAADLFLKKFWETEEKFKEKNSFLMEEQKTEDFFKETSTVG